MQTFDYKYQLLAANVGKLIDLTTTDSKDITGIINRIDNELFVCTGHNNEISISLNQISSIDNIEEL